MGVGQPPERRCTEVVGEGGDLVHVLAHRVPPPEHARHLVRRRHLHRQLPAAPQRGQLPLEPGGVAALPAGVSLRNWSWLRRRRRTPPPPFSSAGHWGGTGQVVAGRGRTCVPLGHAAPGCRPCDTSGGGARARQPAATACAGWPPVRSPSRRCLRQRSAVGSPAEALRVSSCQDA